MLASSTQLEYFATYFCAPGSCSGAQSLLLPYMMRSRIRVSTSFLSLNQGCWLAWCGAVAVGLVQQRPGECPIFLIKTRVLLMARF